MATVNDLGSELRKIQNSEALLKDNSLAAMAESAAAIGVLIETMRDALEDAEYQLSMFADCDKEDTDAHDAHAKVQGALLAYKNAK